MNSRDLQMENLIRNHYEIMTDHNAFQIHTQTENNIPTTTYITKFTQTETKTFDDTACQTDENPLKRRILETISVDCKRPNVICTNCHHPLYNNEIINDVETIKTSDQNDLIHVSNNDTDLVYELITDPLEMDVNMSQILKLEQRYNTKNARDIPAMFEVVKVETEYQGASMQHVDNRHIEECSYTEDVAPDVLAEASRKPESLNSMKVENAKGYQISDNSDQFKGIIVETLDNHIEMSFQTPTTMKLKDFNAELTKVYKTQVSNESQTTEIDRDIVNNHICKTQTNTSFNNVSCIRIEINQENLHKNSNIQQIGNLKLKISTEPNNSHQNQQSVNNSTNYFNSLISSRLKEAIKEIDGYWELHEKIHSNDKRKTKHDCACDVMVDTATKSRKHEKEMKFLALNLLYSNPTAYQCLRAQLNLPSKKILSKIDIGISTKLTATVLKCLSLMVSKLREDERHCIVCADLLSLKEDVHRIPKTDNVIGLHEVNEIQSDEAATQALVVMAKGLYSDWKQPIASCYLKDNFQHDEANAWLDEIIYTLHQIGFNVVALTTNNTTHFVAMAHERKVSPEQTYFYIFDKKIYYIFDGPNLMIELRNALMVHDFKFKIKTKEWLASWTHIEKFYEFDKKRKTRLAPNLSESHVRPLLSDKSSVTHAVQVFSRTVATGIKTFIQTRVLPATGTIKLLELLNDLFDVLNTSGQNETYKCINPESLKSYQKVLLEKVLFVLSNIKIVSSDSVTNLVCFQSLTVTIKSVISLSADMSSCGYDYIFTRNLNMDCLDSYLGGIRMKWCGKTTPVLFRANFRNFFLENLIKRSDVSSCGLDEQLSAIFMNAKEVAMPQNIYHSDVRRSYKHL